MQAMILAAGLGTRLRPYSLIKPKPLFPVLGIPLLFLTIGALRRAGCTKIVVNAHHLKEQIRDALTGEPDIILQEEEQILGTGGGLRLAKKHFGTKPVLVVNGDIYHNINMQDVYQNHLVGKSPVSLVLHDFPRFNNVPVAGHAITGFASAESESPVTHKLAFTGIHVIDPDILGPIPSTGFADIIDRYRECIAQGTSIRADIVTNHFWTDMGTESDYLALHAGLLDGRIPACQELSEAMAEAPFHRDRHRGSEINVQFKDWVSIGEGVTIGNNTEIARTVVWNNAVIAPGIEICDTIITGLSDRISPHHQGRDISLPDISDRWSD